MCTHSMPKNFVISNKHAKIITELQQLLNFLPKGLASPALKDERGVEAAKFYNGVVHKKKLTMFSKVLSSSVQQLSNSTL